FDVTRDARDQLAWGRGAHMCAGQYLARIEMEVLLEALVERGVSLEASEPVVGANKGLFGFTSLPMRLNSISNEYRMYLLTFRNGGKVGLAASPDGQAWRGLLEGDARYTGALDALIRQAPVAQKASIEALLGGQPIDVAKVELLQPLRHP